MIRKSLERALILFLGEGSFRKVLQNAGILLSAELVNAILNLVQAIIITRALGTRQYGILVLVMTYAILVNQLAESRVWETGTRYITQFYEKQQFQHATAVLHLAYLIDTVTALLAFMVLMLSAGFAAELLAKDTSTTYLFRLFSVSVLVNIFYGSSAALLRVADRFKWLSYHTVGVSVLRTVAVLIVALIGATIENMILALLFALIVRNVTVFALAYLAGKQMHLDFTTLSFGLLRGHLREILSFTLFTNLSATSRLIQSRADILILGWLGTPAAVAVYELAKRLVEQLTIFANPLYTSVYPEFALLVTKGEFEAVRHLRRRLSTSLMAVVIAACIGASIGAIWIIPLLFGKDYHDSIRIFQIQVWQLLWITVIWFQGWMLSLGRSKMLAAALWAYTIVFIILLLILVPAYMAVGAAIATVLGIIAWVTIALIVTMYLDNKGWYNTLASPVQ